MGFRHDEQKKKRVNTDPHFFRCGMRRWRYCNKLTDEHNRTPLGYRKPATAMCNESPWTSYRSRRIGSPSHPQTNNFWLDCRRQGRSKACCESKVSIWVSNETQGTHRYIPDVASRSRHASMYTYPFPHQQRTYKSRSPIWQTNR